MELPYEPVFLDSSLSGTILLAMLPHLGVDGELRYVAIGWYACSKGRLLGCDRTAGMSASRSRAPFRW